jgi:ubiquinol-cytochrome c reductase cytochrome c1 subunit
MAPPLSDGMIEYDDGTPATVSQMAKDVSTLLAFTSTMENDERKKMGFKYLLGGFLLTCVLFYHKRFRWTLLKNRRVNFEKAKF